MGERRQHLLDFGRGKAEFLQFCPKMSNRGMEANQIGKRECLIKLLSEQNRGGFARLMENMDSLGLQVVDANVTTLYGTVLCILNVEANEDTQAKKLRDFNPANKGYKSDSLI